MKTPLTEGRGNDTLPATIAINLPTRLLDIMRRLNGLRDGRYILTLTVNGSRLFWTVAPLGNLERNLYASQSQEQER